MAHVVCFLMGEMVGTCIIFSAEIIIEPYVEFQDLWRLYLRADKECEGENLLRSLIT